MSECCGPSQSCCGEAPAAYEYGPEPYVTGTIDTFAGPVRRVSTELTAADARGTVRVRLGVRRSDYRIRPALYAVGEPDDTSPVLVTGNYKLTFDTVRRELTDRDVWLLVIDTRGINHGFIKRLYTQDSDNHHREKHHQHAHEIGRAHV